MNPTMQQPMLGVDVPVEAIQYPVLASAKLDGVRGVIVDGVLRSRSLKRIPNPHIDKALSDPRLNGLDGEIVVGPANAKDVCRKTTGTCSRAKWTPDAAAPSFAFYVFDDWTHPGTFAERVAATAARVAKLKDPRIVMHQQVTIPDESTLLAFEEVALGAGFEGLILRDPQSSYKQGRSTVKEAGMLKVKRFTDSEAEVIEVIEEMANTNPAMRNDCGRTVRSHAKAGMVPKGRMGALRCRDLKSGIVFELGAGYDSEARDWYWTHREKVAGMIVKYKSFKVGEKDKPRHGVYLGPRAKWDL